MRQRIGLFVARWQTMLLGAMLTLSAFYLTQNLMSWQAYDDEGGYLYAAWRITRGELPYRDFLTPQLPLFLYPGAAVLGLTNLSVLAVRLYMLVLCLGTVVLLFLTLRRMGHHRAAWIALPLLVIHQELFWAARFFRPEAPMLFFTALGIYLFVEGYLSGERTKLALAGVAFGLSMMSKLFGMLPLGGIGLFMLVEGARTRKWREHLWVLLYVVVPFVLVVLAIGGLFTALTPNFVAAVLGHHVRQGSGTPLLQVVLKAFDLFRSAIVYQPVYVLLALAGAALGWRAERWSVRVFACQLPTALSFFVLTRDLQLRHLTYLAPSCAALAALALEHSWMWLASRPRWARAAAGLGMTALVALALWPHAMQNQYVTTWVDRSTPDWVRLIQEHTAPDDVVISDYPGLNFYARRRTTWIAAGISAGAAESGQILGADLIREIEQSDAKMVIYNVAQGSHQIVHLRDYGFFKEYVQSHFQLYDRLHYDSRLMDVYTRRDLWEGRAEAINFGNQLALTGLHWLRDRAEPGQQLQIKLRWQSMEPMVQDYGVTLRLLDQQGHLWGLGHKTLADIESQTYYNERGLEVPVMIPTSKWPTHETTVQTFELPIDPATPPGQYSVELRVHPKATWDGLHVLDAAGAPAGLDWQMGEVEVLTAAVGPDPTTLQIEQRVNAALAPQLFLLGHSGLPAKVRPGDAFSFSLFWQAGAAPRPDYQLRLTLRDGDRTWSQVLTSPARSDYPSSGWSSGEILRGQHDVLVDAETPTGTYRLYAALVDEAASPVAEPIVLASLRVEGRQRRYEAPQLDNMVNGDLGGLVTLLGYNLTSASVSQREGLTLTLYWRAEQRTTTSYKVFVHVIDEQGQVRAQKDSEPVDNTYPTTAWLPGEVVEDVIAVPIDQDLMPGSYYIEVGIYDPQTGTRLAARNAQGETQAGDRIVLQQITVVQ